MLYNSIKLWILFQGESKAIQIWKDLGITWSEVLPERLTTEEFLSRKVHTVIHDRLLKWQTCSRAYS